MRHLIIAAALTMASACASATDVAESPVPTNSPAGRDCFHNDQVNGFGYVDDDTLSIRVSPNRNYAVTAHNIGRNLRYEQSVALRAPTGWICTGDAPNVDVYGGGLDSRRYLVRSIERIVEAPASAEASEEPAAEGS
jgi:hypothetical protein